MDIYLEDNSNGLDCLNEMKNTEHLSNIPILFMTGQCDKNTVSKSKAIKNYAGIISKPFNEEELLSHMESVSSNQFVRSKKKFFDDVLKSKKMNINSFLLDFGKYIKQIRKEQQITQIRLAEKLDINYRHYQNVERGKVNMRMELFLKLLCFATEREYIDNKKIINKTMNYKTDQKHILLVDDDSFVQSSIKRILNRDGYKVTLAGNGNEALRILKFNKIDLIVSDIAMPEKDGVELAEDLSKLSSEIPVILITGNCQYVNIDQKRLNIEKIFIKPFDINNFLTLISQIFSSQDENNFIDSENVA